MDEQLTDELYLLFRDLMQERCGLAYPERKRADLAHGLGAALRASKLGSLAQLYADARAHGPAWETLVASLTIGETYFFRNQAQFDALREQIVPELIARRSSIRTLRIWSAGCATGEEPYSIAMMLSELLPDPAQWQVHILATDINPQFLARAREGLYGNWSFRDTESRLRDIYFTPEGNRWRLSPSIRQMVNFSRLNLVEPCYPAIINGTYGQDIIFCRNVTIYFDEPTTRQIIERFYAALFPGGWLVVGHAEPQADLYQRFEVHNFPRTILYRKQLDAPYFTELGG